VARLVEKRESRSILQDKSREFIVRTAEDFYVSLGFPRLPEVFWQKSDLFRSRKHHCARRNTTPSAWHIDREATCVR